MAIQFNTLHLFLVLTIIYCSSSFSMNYHCWFLPMLGELKKIQQYTEQDFLRETQNIYDEEQLNLISENSLPEPLPTTSKPDTIKNVQKHHRQPAKLTISIKKTKNKPKQKRPRNNIFEGSFCPCKKTEATSTHGLAKHIFCHHFNEITGKHECPECKEEFESALLVIDHLEGTHKFFYRDGRSLFKFNQKQQQHRRISLRPSIDD